MWTGSRKADGTGKMKVEGKTVTASRVGWLLAHGPVPSGGEVLGARKPRAAYDRTTCHSAHLKPGSPRWPPPCSGEAAGRRAR